MQGLVGAIFEGVGVSTGSFIGGYLMKSVGGSQTFRLFGLAALICAALHFIVQKLLDRFSSERGKIYDYEDNDKYHVGDGNGIAGGGAPIDATIKSNNKPNLLLNSGENGFVDVSLEDVTKL